MKTIFPLLLCCAALSFLAACNNAPAGEEAQTGDEVATSDASTTGASTYAVDVETSRINWVGSKLAGKQHKGYMLIQNGKLLVQDGALTGGKFMIDINSLTDEDLQPGEGKEDLEGHLKSDDFFDVANYPTAKFIIAEVKPLEDNAEATHEITGNLTMKGTTKSIVIPAKVSVDADKVTATTPPFTIDRTKWNVMYGSGLLGVAQDEIINDKVGLQIVLNAQAGEDMLKTDQKVDIQ